MLEGVVAGEGDPAAVMAARGLEVVSDYRRMTAAVDEAIAANPEIAAKIRDGKVSPPARGAGWGRFMRNDPRAADAKTGERSWAVSAPAEPLDRPQWGHACRRDDATKHAATTSIRARKSIARERA